MKRRLRKKLHKAEFQQSGMSLFIPANTNNINEVLDAITNITDNNNILFIGGGLEYFTMRSKKFGTLGLKRNWNPEINFSSPQ